jgi:hypothetical protein
LVLQRGQISRVVQRLALKGAHHVAHSPEDIAEPEPDDPLVGIDGHQRHLISSDIVRMLQDEDASVVLSRLVGHIRDDKGVAALFEVLPAAPGDRWEAPNSACHRNKPRPPNSRCEALLRIAALG